MRKRNPFLVFFLPIITFGIYGIVWYVMTKNEMNTEGAEIPTAWLIIVPIVSWYWMWKFCGGVELVTKKGMTTGISFVLIFFFGIIGMAIIQSELNKVAV